MSLPPEIYERIVICVLEVGIEPLYHIMLTCKAFYKYAWYIYPAIMREFLREVSRRSFNDIINNLIIKRCSICRSRGYVKTCIYYNQMPFSIAAQTFTDPVLCIVTRVSMLVSVGYNDVTFESEDGGNIFKVNTKHQTHSWSYKHMAIIGMIKRIFPELNDRLCIC